MLPLARLGIGVPLLAITLAACGSDPVVSPEDDASVIFDLGGGPVDSGTVDSGEGAPDAAPPDLGSGDLGAPDLGRPDTGTPDSGAPPLENVCTELGLPTRSIQPGASTYQFGDVAGDFTVTTLSGSWTLSNAWTGCESYLFVTYAQSGGSPSQTERFWQSSPMPLIQTPFNAHYFFMSWERSVEERRVRVEAMRMSIESALASSNLTPAQVARQRSRFHFVTDAPRQIPGSLGAYFTDYSTYFNDPASRIDLGDRGQAPPPFPLVVGIDRFQEWDSVGSVSDVVGGNFDLRMVSYLPAFYDHKIELEDRLAAETGVDEHVLLDEVVTERIFTRTATLPDASAMAGYDTLEVDVGVRCRERNVFACSEWDRIARIDVCLDSSCGDRRELVRWITPYWRRGERRWVMDASALLGLLRQGGLQYFRIEMGPGWERKTPRDARMALRFSNRGRSERATGAVRAFGGGRFDGSYNQSKAPFSFDVPATAQRVELVYILSGHGQESGSNCAEWCDHRHQFEVNGSALPQIYHRGSVGSRGGCGPAAAGGASPGQWGNWAPERAYWCPGLPVAHERIDITPHVNLGGTSTITYSASWRGREPPGGSISLSAYVVWSE